MERNQPVPPFSLSFTYARHRLHYNIIKAEMGTIQQQMVEAKKYERANALKEVKRLCKEFGFTAGMLKGALAEGKKGRKT